MTLEQLRLKAVSNSLFQPTTLRKAVARLGFIQADPIRSPARAQDLILRQRVLNYKAGDLEAKYPKLHLEEDFLYAYGFMSHAVWNDLHPRLEAAHNETEQRILDIVTSHRTLHPRQLEAYFGSEREVNAWGGYSKRTTRALEALLYRGYLRVAKRENGIRLYERTVPPAVVGDPDLRLQRLVKVIVKILSPISERSLRATLQLFARGAPSLKGRHNIVARLIESGELEGSTVDQVRYVWRSDRTVKVRSDDQVRFLAPFDPVVWDRRRFEHFWGWAYRFEAYTPAAKRIWGYYAMPILWHAEAIGWVNISNINGVFALQSGFVKKRPAGTLFDREFEAEVTRVRAFLGLKSLSE